jgi:hypothetical protein
MSRVLATFTSMSASTSRVTLRAISRGSQSHSVARSTVRTRQAICSPLGRAGQVRLASDQPKQIGKGKENERYNYNTSMSFSDEIDPDVSHLHFTHGVKMLILIACELSQSDGHRFDESTRTAYESQDACQRFH